MDNWDDLKFIVAVARFGSMAQAALHLRTNTATVSRRIKRINDSSGITVFNKGRKDWELTPEGRKLFDIAARFNDELTEFSTSHNNKDKRQRVIRISTLEFLINDVFSPNLGQHYQKNPNISLELSANDQIVSLAFGEADLAVRLARPDEGRLVVKSLANIKMGIFAHANSTPNDWVGLPSNLDGAQEMRNGYNHFSKPPVMRLASFQAIRNVVQNTGLAGIGPNFIMEKHPNIQPIETKCEILPRQAWLVYHETRRNDHALREVANWVEQAFNDHVN
ncbi:MAG: LysR family transcriptional regulator [Rhodobacteraceae bacterium]|nr:LysR family transcriptional regulator [Paracoccaceae bacterium]